MADPKEWDPSQPLENKEDEEEAQARARARARLRYLENQNMEKVKKTPEKKERKFGVFND